MNWKNQKNIHDESCTLQFIILKVLIIILYARLNASRIDWLLYSLSRS